MSEPMAGIKLQKRAHDFFVSYGHEDRARVAPLVELLKRTCGLSVWFDDTDGNASVRSHELLAEAIGNARGVLCFLTAGWTRSPWCRDEWEVALSEQCAHDGFEIVCVRLDGAELPRWCKTREIVDIARPEPRAVARLLRSLNSEVPHRFDNAQDVYLAAPWNRPSPIARETFQSLQHTGWRLVGDSPDLAHMAKGRVEAIQRTARGVIAYLPLDSSQPNGATSRFIVEEARMALEIGKPLLLLAEPGVTTPEDLAAGAFRGEAIVLTETNPRAASHAAFEAFDERLRHVSHDDTRAFIFFAGSLRDQPNDADDVASVIERSSNMQCIRGERLDGDNVQAGIIDRIRRAAVVIADVSDDHRNTLIEAGIAMGSGTRLKLMSRAQGDGTPPKKRFMFEGQELFCYQTPEERLGLCYYFARQFRRRVYRVR